MAIDFQALMDIARVNEEKVSDRQFWMGTFLKSECGTVGCLIGNWILHEKNNCRGLRFGREVCRLYPVETDDADGYDALVGVLGLRYIEVEFLFGDHFDLREHFPRTRGTYRGHSCQTRAASIARLRKFIYYRLRKAEILADYERARHQEGDWNVAKHAREMAGCV